MSVQPLTVEVRDDGRRTARGESAMLLAKADRRPLNSEAVAGAVGGLGGSTLTLRRLDLSALDLGAGARVQVPSPHHRVPLGHALGCSSGRCTLPWRGLTRKSCFPPLSKDMGAGARVQLLSHTTGYLLVRYLVAHLGDAPFHGGAWPGKVASPHCRRTWAQGRECSC